MRALLAVVVVLSVASLAAAADITLLANGKTVTSDPAPMMQDGHVYVPLRAAAEAVGGDVKYDAASKTVTICRGDVCSFLKQSDGITVNGRLLVGIRKVAEAVDVQVDWDGPAQTVRISTAPKPEGTG